MPIAIPVPASAFRGRHVVISPSPVHEPCVFLPPEIKERSAQRLRYKGAVAQLESLSVSMHVLDPRRLDPPVNHQSRPPDTKKSYEKLISTVLGLWKGVVIGEVSHTLRLT